MVCVCTLTYCLLLLAVCTCCCQAVSVQSVFNQYGVAGSVLLSQQTPTTSLTATLQLEGLQDVTSDPVPWEVGSLPFSPSWPDPCPSTGQTYRNLAMLNTTNLVQILHYDDITLFGVDSIVGRSLVIKVNETLSVCANIDYPEEGPLLHAPFRGALFGDIFLRQYSNSTSVTISLSSSSSSSIPWLILPQPNSTCSTTSHPYSSSELSEGEGDGCGLTNQTACAEGDLIGKHGELPLLGGQVRRLFTDTHLPLAPLSGLPLAMAAPGDTVQCSQLYQYDPVRAVAEVSADGLSGRVQFQQDSPTAVTLVTMFGLEEAELTVHQNPPGVGGDCEATGGLFDPRGVGQGQGGTTKDSYPFGALNAKFAGSTSYMDPYLPLSGPDSIIGRSLMVAGLGQMQLCATIKHDGPVEQLTVTIATEGFSGTIHLSQPANRPFADTVITIETNFDPEIDFVSSTFSFPVPSTSLSSSFSPSSSPSSFSPSPSTPTPFPTSLVLQETQSLLMPLPTTSSSPLSITSIGTFGSGLGESSILLPLLESTTPTPLPPQSMSSSSLMSSLIPSTGGGVKRRRRRSGTEERLRRQVSAVQFRWSFRQVPSDGVLPDDCSQLELLSGGSDASSTECSSTQPLACAVGDLTGKHGLLSGGPFTAVFSDPHLPLSGPTAVTSAVLLVEPVNAVGPSVCALVVPPAPPSSSSPTTTSISSPAPPSKSKGLDTGVLVAAIVGGVVGAALLLSLIVLISCLTLRRLRGRSVDLTKSSGKKRDVELGNIRPYTEPCVGSSDYRALYDYHPQNLEDLQLVKGQCVMLLEAPYGGEWWRGRVGEVEGWFPKTYVEHVDVQQERRMVEEENFKMAAAAIVAASSSFSLRHGSMQTKRPHTPNSSQHTHTISKQDIDSTPKLITKFDHSTVESVVIENSRQESGSSANSSQPQTPRSQRSAEVIPNHIAISEPSGGQNGSQAVPAEISLKFESFMSKYNYLGGTDIELPLRKGETVKVIDKAESGWWQGMSGGRVGWFPASYVKPMPEQQQTSRTDTAAPPTVTPQGMAEGMASDIVEATEFQAVHSFQSGQEGDLQFEIGASILVYWAHDNGWWYGSTGTAQGWFPGTYVEPAVESSEAGSQIASPVPPTTEEASADNVKGTGQKVKRKKWSFKRKKDSPQKVKETMVGEEKREESKKEVEEEEEEEQKVEDVNIASLGDTALFAVKEVEKKELSPVPEAKEADTAKPAEANTGPPSPLSSSTPPKLRKASTHKAKPRRRAPPPPVKESTNPSAPHSPKPALPSSHSCKPPPPTSQSPANTTPSPSPKPPAHITAIPQATPPMGRTYTSAGGHVRQQPARTKRRTSASGQLKPRRRPPPPPTPKLSLSSLTPPPTEQITHSELRAVEEIDYESQKTAAEVVKNTVSQKAVPQAETNVSPQQTTVPVAAPRRKVKVHRVKRPATRLIPPPPSMPLPLPPERRPTLPPAVEETKGPGVAVAMTTSKPKPPLVKPKPEHLSKMMKRKSDPNFNLSGRTDSPTSPPPSSTIPTPPASELQRSPRPAPPARISSLGGRPALSRQHQTSPSLPSITDTTQLAVAEVTDEDDTDLTSSVAVPSVRSGPPQHPPPPRPRPSTQDDSEKANGGPRSRPPSFPPPQRPVRSNSSVEARRGSSPPTTVSRSSSIKAKGSNLMRSLKKMVRRSESREEEGQEGTLSPIATSPPPLGRKEGEVIENLTVGSTPQSPSLTQPQATATSDAHTLSSQHKPTANTLSCTPNPEQPTTQTAVNGMAHSPSPEHSPTHSPGPSSSSRSTSPQLPTNFYRATKAYTAQTASELTLQTGDILIEIDRPTHTMHYGMLDDGTTGLFPVDCVQPLLTPSRKK